jgi:hypothetical protein
MNCRVRPYQATDRAAVRRICADTGFMGNPIDVIFSDREVFADFFTRYYTDYEPECALVTEDTDSGQIVGYMLGCVRYRYQAVKQVWLMLTRLAPKAIFRFLTGRYNRTSREFLYWVLFKSVGETPPAPRRAAHFHINLLPAYRTGVSGREMVFSFFELARTRGVDGIYGQIQTRDDRRNTFWLRYGFKELARRRITKFQRLHTEPVYVSTLYRPFRES